MAFNGEGDIYQGELNEFTTFILISRTPGVKMKDMIEKKKQFTNGNTSLNKPSSKGGV